MATFKNILVVRNDKLGDFMLAWPAFSLLKQQYPDATITALVPLYTMPMAEICPWIDQYIIDERHDSVLTDTMALLKKIKAGNFDAVITLYSEIRTGLATLLAGIPLRLAPATKITQIFYNTKLTQRRSRSEKPEYLYNVDLVKHFIEKNNEKSNELQSPPFLTFDTEEISSIKEEFIHKNNINAASKLIFIHPGTGGSAINLDSKQFSDIARIISQSVDSHIVITAGPDEKAAATELSEQFDDISHTIYHSTSGIVQFSKFLAICDLFISGSTGPLHIAGALNRPTAAFYPARRSATPLRWQTLNTADRRLAFTPETHVDEHDMKTIDPDASTNKIVSFLLK